MTYLKTTLFAMTASVALTSTALAGDMHKKSHDTMKTKTKVQTTVMTEKTDVRGAMEANTDVDREDFVGDILQSNETNVARMKGDDELLMSVGVTEEPETIDMEERRSTAADNAIAVPTTDGQFVTTVACPIGTTAQPDMTCLVTGDYKPSL